MTPVISFRDAWTDVLGSVKTRYSGWLIEADREEALIDMIDHPWLASVTRDGLQVKFESHETPRVALQSCDWVRAGLSVFVRTPASSDSGVTSA